MKIAPWKKYLSYLTELRIETRSSSYNPVLIILLKNGQFQLCTEKAIYSYGDRYDNFKLAFQKVNLDLKDSNVLILGLGLGSIPLMLETSFGKKFNYTAVEIDEEVIDLAEKYVLNELSSPMTCIQANAEHFVYQTQEKYDLITMDVFESDIIPDVFMQIEFLSALKGCLSANGYIIYNTLAATKEDKRIAQAFYNDKFLKVFPNGELINIKGNYMLISDEKFIN